MNWESVLDHTFVLKNFFSVHIIKYLISIITLSVTCQKVFQLRPEFPYCI